MKPKNQRLSLVGCASPRLAFETGDSSDECAPVALEECAKAFKANGLLPGHYVFLPTYPVLYKGKRMTAYLFEEKRGVYGGMVTVVMTEEYKVVDFSQGCL